MIDRSEVSRALAKAIAYKNCGKHEEAERWAACLVGLLQMSHIIRTDRIDLVFMAGSGGLRNNNDE